MRKLEVTVDGDDHQDGLVRKVEQLDLVVNGDPERDVAGVRPRMTKNEDEVKALKENWRGFRLLIIGIGIGLVASQGGILVVLSQILQKLGGMP